MRTPIRTKGARQSLCETETLPAPVSGWNARDSLADMQPTEAVELVNLFPKTSTCEVRGGTIRVRLAGAYAQTLVTYHALNGTSTIWALSEFPYNVTTAIGTGNSGASLFVNGVADGTRLTAFRFIWTMFGDGTTSYLIAVNGADNPLYYDGTTWQLVNATSSPALTGTTIANLNYVMEFKGRLFFVQKQSLSVWYLAAGAAGGALTEFDFSAEANRGGYLVAIAKWTRDAGDGQDDVFVAYTSEGEAILYQGNNPAVAANWSKVGTFFIGKPLGNRCMLQFAADLLVLTENGIFPLSSALQTAKISNQYAISFKIEKAFTDAARANGSAFGWKMIHYPRQNALIVNVPIREGVEYEQYVMNTITKAWCQFTGWVAVDFAIWDGKLMLLQAAGTQAYVHEAWAGDHDFATLEYATAQATFVMPIPYAARQAYTYLESTTQQTVTMMRPVLDVPGHLTYAIGLDTDFQETPNENTVAYRSPQAVWGEAIWGVSTWPVEPEIAREWTTPGEFPGRCVSVKFSGEVVPGVPDTDTIGAQARTEPDNLPDIRWIATDLVYESGGIL